MINVLITFVPRVLFQRVGENSGNRVACITSVTACLRSTEISKIRLSLIVRVNIVLNRTVTVDSD